MKKIIATVLILMMVVGLAGCSAVENLTQTSEEKLAALPQGSIAGNVYTAEEADIVFAKPAGWNFIDRATVESTLGDTEKEQGVRYDMMASNPQTGEVAFVMYQVGGSAIGGKLVEKTYLNLVKMAFAGEADEEVKFGESESFTLGDAECTRSKGIIKQDGQESVLAAYLIMKQDFVAMIILNATDEAALSALENQFGKTAAENVSVTSFTQGSYSGNTYQNSFAGLTFEKPDDWDYMSSSELANEMGLSGDALTDENVAATYTEEGYIYDMYALSPDGGNVIFYLENAVGGDEQDYIESIKQELQTDEEVTYSDVEVGTRTLGGAQYRSVATRGEYEGMKICQTYYLKVVDGVMCAAIITALDETELADTEACFK